MCGGAPARSPVGNALRAIRDEDLLPGQPRLNTQPVAGVLFVQPSPVLGDETVISMVPAFQT
jgi:hypothetical protein